MADVATTWRFIGGGYLHEGNAIPAAIFRRFGLPRGFLVTETVGGLLLLGYSVLFVWLGAPFLWLSWLFWAVGGMGCLTGIWNTHLFLRNRRRIRPVMEILRVAGGQQAWIYSFIWPAPAASSP